MRYEKKISFFLALGMFKQLFLKFYDSLVKFIFFRFMHFLIITNDNPIKKILRKSMNQVESLLF